MARIPDATAFGTRPSGDAARPLVNVQSVGAGYGRAADIISADASRVGTGLGSVATGLSKVGEETLRTEEYIARQQNSLDMASAKSSLIQASINVEGKLKDDPNYDGWAEAYQKEMTDQKETILKRFKSPTAAQLFGSAADASIARGVATVRDNARKRADQAVAGYATELATSTVNSALATADESQRANLFNAFNEYVSAAVGKGSITEQQGVVLKRHVAESYAEGWVQTRPLGELLKILPPKTDENGNSSFPKTGTPIDLISPERRLTLLRSAEVEVERTKRLLDDQKRDAQMKTADTFLVRLQPGVDNPLTPKDILASNLDPAHKKQFLDMLEKSLEPQPIKTDPTIFTGLFDRINLPDGDPNKISNEADLNRYTIERKLSFEDLGRLRGEIQGRRTQAGDIEATLKKGLVEIAKSELTGTNPLLQLRDPIGDTQLQKFMSQFLPEYERQRQAGKTAIQLLSPESPDYLGKAIEQFRRPPDVFMRDLLGFNPQLRPAVPQPPTAR